MKKKIHVEKQTQVHRHNGKNNAEHYWGQLFVLNMFHLLFSFDGETFPKLEAQAQSIGFACYMSCMFILFLQ